MIFNVKSYKKHPQEFLKTRCMMTKQIGVCREADNDRLCDFGGRDTVPVAEEDKVALDSVALYKQTILKL